MVEFDVKLQTNMDFNSGASTSSWFRSLIGSKKTEFILNDNPRWTRAYDEVAGRNCHFFTVSYIERRVKIKVCITHLDKLGNLSYGECSSCNLYPIHQFMDSGDNDKNFFNQSWFKSLVGCRSQMRYKSQTHVTPRDPDIRIYASMDFISRDRGGSVIETCRFGILPSVLK